MTSIIEQSFGLNITCLRVFGLYPPQKHKSLYKLHTYSIYLVCIVSVPVLGCLNLLLRKELSFMQITDNVFLLAELGCFIPKLWPFVKHGERLKNCIHYFDSPMFFSFEKDHVKIMESCVKICKRTTFIFLACVSAGFASWSSRPISWKGHTFPTEIWLPFDLETAPTMYIACVYAYLVLAVGYSAYSSGVIDPMIGGLAYQATAQIKVLKNNLQFLDKYVDEESRRNTREGRWAVMYRMIRKCIDHHNAILRFVAEYEECFSQVAFSQFVGGVVVVCVSCLQLTIVDPLSFDFLAMIMYLIAMLSEIYLYCHFGTTLYHESVTITDAIYMGKWYTYDIKCRKALIMLRERSKRPIIVTTGKILNLSLETFAMILRRSYSLLAVLKNYKTDSSNGSSTN